MSTLPFSSLKPSPNGGVGYVHIPFEALKRSTELKSRVTQVISANKVLIETLAQRLVRDRELSGEELIEFMREHKHLVNVSYTTFELPFLDKNIKSKKALIQDLPGIPPRPNP